MSRKGTRQRESWAAAPPEPFVSIFRSTLQEPAWKAMSFGARALFVLLRSFYNGQNNGRLYLSIRKAASELGASRTSVVKWFRELDEHGFIRPTQRGFLGPDGDAQAAYWRLTEVGHMGEPPTREYRSWTPPKNKSPDQKMTGPDQKVVQGVPKNGPANGEVDQKVVQKRPLNDARPVQKVVHSTFPYDGASVGGLAHAR